MTSVNRGQQGGQWASTGGWDDDDLFDAPPSFGTSHPPKQQPLAVQQTNSASNGHNTFSSGWDDDDSDFFANSTPTAPLAAQPASNGHHHPANSSIRPMANTNVQQIRITPTTGSNLFESTSPGPSSAPVQQSALSSKSKPSNPPVASSKPLSSFIDDGWDDELSFSSKAPQSATVALQRPAVATQVPQSSAKAAASTAVRPPAANPATVVSNQAAKVALPVQPQTRAVPPSTPANGATTAIRTPNSTAQINSVASSQPQHPTIAPIAAIQTPLKQAPVASHQGTPTVAFAKTTSGEAKTPLANIRAHKPSSSIKLPSMPTRTPQPKAPAPTAAPVAAATSQAPAATPQAAPAVAKVPGSSRRLTEEGKPIPLTRTSSRPVIPDSPVVPTTPAQNGSSASTVTPIATQTPKAPASTAPEVTVVAQSTPLPKVVAATSKSGPASKVVPTPVTIAKPTAMPVTFDDDWGDDEFIDASAAQPAATVPSVAPLADSVDAEKEKILEPSTKADLSSTSGAWDESWGESDEEGESLTESKPASNGPLSHESPDNMDVKTLDGFSTGETQKAALEDEKKVEATPAPAVVEAHHQPETANGFDMDWGDDEEDSMEAQAAPVIEPKVEDARSKLDTLVPKTVNSTPSTKPPLQQTESGDSAPTVAPTPAKRTAVSFVPPQITPLDPLQSNPILDPTASNPATTPSVFQPSTPSTFQPVSAPMPLSGPFAGPDASASPKQPKKSAAQPPKPRVSVPAPTGFVATISTPALNTPTASAAVNTFTPVDPSIVATTSLPTTTPAMAPPTAAVPPVRQHRPKATAPKMQPVYTAPFSAASTPSTTTTASRIARSSHPGPLTKEDMQRPRAIATFGFGGMLIMSQPRLGSSFSNQPPQAGPVSLISTGQLLSNNPDVIAMKAFPGPAISKSAKELTNLLTARCKHVDQAAQHVTGSQTNPVRIEAARLLWHMLRLLLESKGALSGPKGCEKAMYALLADAKSQNGASSPSPLDSDPLASAILGDCTESLVTLEKRKSVVLDIQQLVQAGKREEALQIAVKEGVWDHALLLSSFISPSVLRDTVSSFVLSTLSIGSPLRMAYLQLAGKAVDLFKLGGNTGGMMIPGALVGGAPFLGGLPSASGPAGFNPMSAAAQSNPYTGLMDHWKMNIATAVANKPPTPAAVAPGANGPQQGQTWHDPALMQLGDALWQHCSSVEAAHLCYLLADLGLDSALNPGSRFVLVGGDHKRHPRTVASNVEAIHRTELLEFAKRQSNSKFCFPRFQPYKLLHAISLADIGMLKLSLEYLESIKHVIGSNAKAAAQVYPPHFLSKLDEWHSRIKDATSGKPISNASHSLGDASSANSGSGSSAGGWFGSFLKAAVDKVIGDEEEERRQMQTSQGQMKGVPASGAPSPNPSTAGIAPPSSALNGPMGTPASGVPNAAFPAANGMPPLSNVKMGFPMPSVASTGPAAAKKGFSAPVTNANGPMLPPTALPKGNFASVPNTPATTTTAPNALTTPGTAPLPSIPLPTIRGAPPKAAVKAPKLTSAKATSATPVAPVAPMVVENKVDLKANNAPTETKDDVAGVTDDDEAELFGGWDIPVIKPEATPTSANEESKVPIESVATTKTAQELEDEAELFNGSFDDAALPPAVDSPKSPKKTAAVDEVKEIDPEPQQTAPVAIDDGTKADLAEPTEPAPQTSSAGFLPPPKRTTAAPPRKTSRTPPVAAFRPSGSPPVLTPATASNNNSTVEDDSIVQKDTSEGADASVTEAVSTPPPPTEETPSSSVAPSQASSAASLDIREATTHVKPPKSGISNGASPSPAATPASSEQPPSPAALTPKRPSLLPPKKTPASKPAVSTSSPPSLASTPVVLAAPEGLPPLSAVAKQPFKPVNAPSNVPPSTQQKRDRMNKSISASALPRPDALLTGATEPADDEAHSDDEKAQEKVIQDAKAEIDREDAASIVPPTSKLPPLSTASKPKEASKRKPMPRPQPSQPSNVPPAFVPPSFVPTAPETSSFTPPKADIPASSSRNNGYNDDASDDEIDSMKTPQQKPKKSEKEKEKEKVKEAPKTEPKRSRFGWMNPRNWFPKTPKQEGESKPVEVKLGSTLKNGPWYRHPELGWVERGKEEEKRQELAASAAPPTKSDKKRSKSGDVSNSSSSDGLVTPQHGRGAFSRSGGISGEEPSTPSVLGTSNGAVPGSSRAGRGRRYVGASGDVVDTKRSSSGASLFPVAPMTPTIGGNGSGISVFTPLEAPKSEEDSASTQDTSTSQEPQEPVATVKQAKKASKEKKDKKKAKASGDAGGSDEDQNDVINSQPLTYSASIPVEEETEESNAPRKSRAERRAEAEAAAAAAATAASASSKTPGAAPGKPKFGSPFGFRPTKGPNSPRNAAPKTTADTSPISLTPSPTTADVNTASTEDEAQETVAFVPPSVSPTPTEPEPAEDEADDTPIAAPLPSVALPSFNLPPAGAARPKSGVRAARPKSAAARFQPTPSPPAAQQ